MIEIIRHCIASILINTVVVLYIISKILNVKIDLEKPKIYVIYFAIVITCALNFVFVDNYLKFLTSTMYIILFSFILFKKNSNIDFGKIVVATILEQLTMFLAELVFMLSIIIIYYICNFQLSDSIQGSLLPNFLIGLIAIMIVYLFYPFYQIIVNFVEKIKEKHKYVIFSILIVTMNVLLTLVYLNYDNLMMVAINVMFMIIYGYIIYSLLSEKNSNIKYREENDMLLTHLNEYEKMLDYQRVNNHENKNQLLVIKTMINKNNKKLINYIDEIITERREDNELLYSKAKKVPSGGLQGLIYQKMLYMQECNINVDLNVSRDIRKINLSELDNKTNFDICRIIGILLDNAIDETKKLKDKEISIYMYKDDEFIIEISNTCIAMPDLELIDNKGYTTKSDGHGYGLTLLKEIVDKNDNIINERKIIGNIFTQIIKIKM